MRGAINEMLAGLGLGTDPAEVLADHGFGDVPPDAIAQALVHYAETADLELADALAPIVTRVSDVPFEEGDLPPVETDGPLPDSSDVFAMLSEVGLGGRDLNALVDDEADPGDFDDLEEAFDEISETVDAEQLAGGHDDDEGEADSTYGVGTEADEHEADEHEADEHDDEVDLGQPIDELGEHDTMSDVGEALSGQLESTFGELLDHEDEVEDFDDDDTDPSDLDLD
jgi:hypothetical protein